MWFFFIWQKANIKKQPVSNLTLQFSEHIDKIWRNLPFLCPKSYNLNFVSHEKKEKKMSGAEEHECSFPNTQCAIFFIVTL